MLTENQIKKLIKYIGECWHETEEYSGGLRCKNCLIDWYGIKGKFRRTFTTPDDKDVLLRAIIEKGEWEDFYGYFIDNEYMNLNNSNLSARKLDIMVYIILLSPIETAELVCKWKGWE